MEMKTAEGFTSLALRHSFVREMVRESSEKLTLKIVRLNSHDGNGNGIAEEGTLSFHRIETTKLNVIANSWLEIVSLHVHEDSQLVADFNKNLASGNVFYKGAPKTHFEVQFETGSIHLLAEAWGYEITRLSAAQVQGTPPD